MESSLENVKDTDVAIIGLGFRFPGASTPETFYQNLLNRKDCIIECPKDRMTDNFFKYHEIDNHGGFLDIEQWKCYDPLFFGSSIPDAMNLEPQIRLLCKVSYETFENASVVKKIRGSDTSVYIGYHVIEYEDIMGKKTMGSYNTLFSTSVSHAFDLRGESSVCATACSSSFTAIQKGYENIILGNSEMSLCGGVSSMISTDFREKSIGAYAITQTGRSHTFEAEADGFCRGEGAGLVLLKKYSKAILDGDKIYGVIKSMNTNNDGCNEKINKAQPSSKAQAENMKDALSKISMEPSEIYYIEPHGTGTPVGDPIEAKALSTIFKDSHTETPLYLGSLKPNIGHLEAGSGVSSLIKSCLMMKHRKLLPMFKFNNPNPDIKFDEWNLKMVTSEMDFPEDKTINIGINNFGIGGTNTFLILGEHKINRPSTSSTSSTSTTVNNEDIEYLIPFSANSTKSLNDYKDKLISNIDNIKNDVKFIDFVKNQINKYHFVNRNVIAAKDWEDLKSLKVKASFESKVVSTLHTNPTIPIVFVFTGQGAQYISMAKELINNNQVFKDAVQYCDSILAKYFGYSVYEKLITLEELKDNQKQNYLINEPILAQPSLFLIQYALIELYKFYGITPSVVLGHSFGEITAAYCAGILSLEDTCKLIYYRAIPQNKTAGMGKMLSISIGKEEFQKRFSKCSFYDDIEIGCYNSTNSIVIVSTKEILDSVKNQLTNDGIFTAYLGTDCPFHSSRQLVIKEELYQSLQFLEESTSNPSIPFYSTVTTNQWTSNDKFNSSYIYDNIAKPVYFDQTLNNIIKNQTILPNNKAIFVEISPHPTLSFYIKSLSQESVKSVICPLNKKKSDIQQFNESISAIFCNGGNVNFLKQSTQLENQNDNSFKFVNDYLPNYEWDQMECWVECNDHHQKRVEGPACDLLGLKSDSGNKIYETLIDVNKSSFKFLKEHSIEDSIIFPGCGYLSTVLNLYVNSGKDITIPYFNCLIPFIIEPSSTYTLQLAITNLSKTDDKFQFFKKENKKDCAWVEVSNGKISTLPHKDIERKLELKQIINNCNLSTLSKDELYLFIKEKFKLEFGPHFMKVDKVYLGNKTAVSVLNSSLFKSKESIFDNSFLNTTILDSLFHCGFVTDLDNDIGKVYLDRIESFRLFTNKIPKSRDETNTLYSVGSVISRKGKSLKIKIQVLFEDGTLLYELYSLFTTNKQINDKIRIKDHEYKYSFNWQSKNSPLLDPTNYNLKCDPPIVGYENKTPASNIASCFYYKFIQMCKPELTLNVIENSSNEELIENYLQDKSSIVQRRVFIKVMNQIRDNKELIISEYPEEEYLNYLKQFYGNPYFIYPFLSRGSLFQVCQLFNKDSEDIAHQIKSPLLDDNVRSKDKQFFESFFNVQSKFEFLENPLLKDFVYKEFPEKSNLSLCNAIKKILQPILYQKYVFKIVEFGGGSCGLSYIFLKTIYELLESNPNYQIKVHFTYSDISSAFIVDAVDQLAIFSKHIKLSYKTFDLDKSLINQGLNQSSYDLVIMQFVLHAVKDIEYSLNQIHQILNPNGCLLFEECSKNDITIDSFFANFSQWTSYEDKIRTDHCCLNINEWYDLLVKVGFSNKIQFSKGFNDNSPSPFIINAQKQPISQFKPISNKYNQIIIYCSENQNQNDQFIKELNQYYSNISNSIITIQSYNQLIKNIYQEEKHQDEDSFNNLIIFAKGLETLDESNFEYFNFELTQISRFLTTNSKYQLLLLTLYAQIESINYLNSTLIGVIKYFFLYPNSKLFAIDLDNNSIINSTSTFNNIQILLNDSNFIERIFSIRNDEIRIEKIHKEPNNQIISNSYEDHFVKCLINNELEYEIHPRPLELGDYQLEIEIKANAVNFKDQLIYTKVVKSKTLCPEFSGEVIRIGNNVTKFKVGDKVYTVKKNVLGSHAIVDEDKCCLIPNNLSYEEAASIISVFITSYFSLYKATQVKNGMVLLIHSATSGVGLCVLNLLKFKQFKGIVLVTVGSEDKEKYLIEKYGDMINGIYSTRNTEFCYEIKEYLNKNTNKSGVDFILNTLPGEYMALNGSILKRGGVLVDLSITHIVKNDLLDLTSMGYHYNYIQVELSKDWTMVIDCLKKITKYIETGLLEIPPLSIYNVNLIKTVFEKIQSRKHIGKFVLNYGDREMFNKEFEKHKLSNTIVKNNYKIDNTLGKTVLITGQRGLALHIIKWILKYSKTVKDIIVLSKSNVHWELEFVINYNKYFGKNVRIHHKIVDVGNMNEIKESISQIYSDFKDIKPVESIFHCAFVLSDSKIADFKLKNIIEANNAKGHGAINLHNISLEYKWPIKNFILNSSLITIIGSEVQLAYTLANYLVEGLARHRKSLGLPAIAIKWGAIDNSYVTRNNVYINHMDYMLTTPKTLGSLDLMIQPNNNHFTEIAFSKSIPKLSNVDTLYSNCFDHYSEKEVKNYLCTDRYSVSSLVDKISSLLQIEKDKINTSLKLIDYGADSLIIIHIKNFIEKQFISISQERLQTSSIKDIIGYITQNLNN